jgi:hypothetical protein
MLDCVSKTVLKSITLPSVFEDSGGSNSVNSENENFSITYKFVNGPTVILNIFLCLFIETLNFRKENSSGEGARLQENLAVRRISKKFHHRYTGVAKSVIWQSVEVTRHNLCNIKCVYRCYIYLDHLK